MTSDNSTLRGLLDLGWPDLIPLRAANKAPRDAAWTTRAYTRAELLAHIDAGGNLGVRIGADQVVLDIDPRADPHGRAASAILADLELDLGADFAAAPQVETGSGGLHVFLSKLPTELVSTHPLALRASYGRAVEIKSRGTQVVAAGSLHPSGNLYRWVRPPPVLLAAPDGLLRVARRAVSEKDSQTSDTPALRLRDLRDLLASTNVRLFDAYSRADWRDRVLFPLHAATQGDPDAREIVLEWAAGSELWAGDSDANGQIWDTAKAGAPNARDLGSFLFARSELGAPFWVAPGDVSDFPDDLPEEATAEEDIPPAPKLLGATLGQVRRHPWAVEPLLLRGAVSVFGGSPGGYKSTWLLHLATALESGVSFGPWEGESRESDGLRVLLISPEDSEITLNARFRAAALALDLPLEHAVGPSVWHADQEPPKGLYLVGLTKQRDVEIREAFLYLDSFLRVHPHDVVMIDPMAQFHLLEENNPAQMTFFFDKLKSLAKRHGCAVLLSHHFTKDVAKKAKLIDRFRGSGGILGACRVAFGIEEEDAPPNVGTYRRVTVAKSNVGHTGESWLIRADTALLAPGVEAAVLRCVDGTAGPHDFGPTADDEAAVLVAFSAYRGDSRVSAVAEQLAGPLCLRGQDVQSVLEHYEQTGDLARVKKTGAGRRPIEFWELTALGRQKAQAFFQARLGGSPG